MTRETLPMPNPETPGITVFQGLNKGYETALERIKQNKKGHLKDADRIAFLAGLVGLFPPFVLGGILLAALSINKLREIEKHFSSDLDFLNFVYDEYLRQLFFTFPNLASAIRKDGAQYNALKTDTMRAYLRGE